MNYWYAHPVGHAIEGLKLCLGYHVGSSDTAIALLLNGRAPAAELGVCCPFISEVYAVPFTSFAEAEGDPAAALVEVPREWSFVMDNHRAHDPDQMRFDGLRTFFEASWGHFRALDRHGIAGTAPPAYVPNQRLTLRLPDELRQAAREELGDGHSIAILPAGSGAPWFYPSRTSWAMILGALAEARPGTRFCILGKHTPDGRTVTRFTNAQFDALAAAFPDAVDGIDRPLLAQLALVEASELFISPHTGFAFAAQAVGIPWLAISGGHWHEYLFNHGVPVYSVLPDTQRYPCFAHGREPLPLIESDDDGEGPRTASMSAERIRHDLPQIVSAAELLLDGELHYEDALADYFPRLLAVFGGDRSRIFTFDGVHEAYLAPA